MPPILPAEVASEPASAGAHRRPAAVRWDAREAAELVSWLAPAWARQWAPARRGARREPQAAGQAMLRGPERQDAAPDQRRVAAGAPPDAQRAEPAVVLANAAGELRQEAARPASSLREAAEEGEVAADASPAARAEAAASDAPVRRRAEAAGNVEERPRAAAPRGAEELRGAAEVERPGERQAAPAARQAVPSVAASAFRQDRSLATGPAPPRWVRLARAMRSLRVASR